MLASARFACTISPPVPEEHSDFVVEQLLAFFGEDQEDS